MFWLECARKCSDTGVQCFEGMKAYRGVDGRVRLFRPDLNMARLKRSQHRLAMPVCTCCCAACSIYPSFLSRHALDGVCLDGWRWMWCCAGV